MSRPVIDVRPAVAEVMAAVAINQENNPSRLHDDVLSLRSMLVQLGECGRALTYDADHSGGLRAALAGMAEIAAGLAMEVYFPGQRIGGVPEYLRNAIVNEAERAHAKHGVNSLLGDGLSDAGRLAALAEECGEAAGLQQPAAQLKELIQVASVCCSWMAWLDAQVPEACVHGSCWHCPDWRGMHPIFIAPLGTKPDEPGWVNIGRTERVSFMVSPAAMAKAHIADAVEADVTDVSTEAFLLGHAADLLHNARPTKGHPAKESWRTAAADWLARFYAWEDGPRRQAYFAYLESQRPDRGENL